MEAGGVEFRHLGRSGLKISEITYGNWLTTGPRWENEAAVACVHAALDAGISTFDTADVYANTAAETVLGEALKGQRRESLEILTKVFGPIGPKGTTTPACPASTSSRRARGRCAGSAPTTSTSTRRTATTTRRRWRRRCRPSPTSCGRARCSTSASASGPPSSCARAPSSPRTSASRSSQPAAVLDAVARHRGRGRPHLEGAGHQPGRVVAHRPGRPHRQVRPGGELPAGSRATDERAART